MVVALTFEGQGWLANQLINECRVFYFEYVVYVFVCGLVCVSGEDLLTCYFVQC